MIYVLSFWSNIGFSIKQALRTFSCNIAAVLYEFIVDLYNVFMYVSRAEILKSSYIQQIYNKVGMILGIFMLFKLTFSLIQSLVDPSKFTDEKKGFSGVIKRSVISIVLLGVTPSIFRMAFDLQNTIVGSANNTDNIIYKIVVGKSPYKNAESFGHIVASELYFGFYTENDPLKLEQGLEITYPDSNGVVLEVNNYENMKSKVEEGRMSFKDTVDYLSITSAGQYVIEWNGLFAIGFAAFTVYILITYCIQVATRVVQLAYLQLVAPVPILSYISDPDGAFKRWTKQCITTYLDLFIRLAIIYFIISVNTQILDAAKDPTSILYSSTGLEEGSKTMFWVKLFLIIGLLMFGKRVPELLKDLFPNNGGVASLGFGIKSPKNMLNDIPLVGGATNKVLGYAGNAGKKVGKWAWNQTGGRGVNKLKSEFNRWKEDKKNANEIKGMERQGKNIYNKYGSDNIAEAFKNEDFKNSYLALKAAKDENRAAEEAYEIAKASGNAEAISNAIKRKNDAAKTLSDAEKTHDNMRKRYGSDARREDQIGVYKSMYPTITGNSARTQQNVDTTQQNNRIILEDHVQSQPRQEATSQATAQDEHSRLVSQYNNETDPNKKAAVRKKIEEFERKH